MAVDSPQQNESTNRKFKKEFCRFVTLQFFFLNRDLETKSLFIFKFKNYILVYFKNIFNFLKISNLSNNNLNPIKLFGLETCTVSHYFIFNFYQINKDDEIRTRDRLVIKILISCQKLISTQ